MAESHCKDQKKPGGKTNMSREEAAARLTEIMRDVFDVDDLQYNDSLKADDVEGWNSLSHVRFLVAVEKQFGFRFTSSEIDGFKNLGEVLDIIVQRATK
jgi:acyl carrier protein